MQMPLNTLERARLILKPSGMTVSVRSKDQIVSCVQQLTKKPDSNPEVSAYDNVSQPAKRQRMGALVESYRLAGGWRHNRRA